MNLYAMENISEELGFLPIQKNFTSWRNRYLNIQIDSESCLCNT